MYDQFTNPKSLMIAGPKVRRSTTAPFDQIFGQMLRRSASSTVPDTVLGVIK